MAVIVCHLFTSRSEQLTNLAVVDRNLKTKYSKAELSNDGKQIDNRCAFVVEPLSHLGKSRESTRQLSKQ